MFLLDAFPFGFSQFRGSIVFWLRALERIDLPRIRETPDKSGRQSNSIARRPKRAIQQTMARNAKARPTSGQTRSSAVNTTPHPVFSLPFGDALVSPLVRWAAGLVLDAPLTAFWTSAVAGVLNPTVTLRTEWGRIRVRYLRLTPHHFLVLPIARPRVGFEP